HADARGARRVEPLDPRDLPLPGRRQSGLPLARGHARLCLAAGEQLLHRLLDRRLPRRRGERGSGAGRALPDPRAGRGVSGEASAYAGAGVDIDAQERGLAGVKKLARATFTPGVLSDIGSFGGLFKLDVPPGAEPVLVASADGVGTKLVVAKMAGEYTTVG